MKSTGEVLGVGHTYEEALAKSFIGAGIALAEQGGLLLSICDRDKEESLPLVQRFESLGYTLYATENTAEFLTNNGVTVQAVPRDSDAVQDLLKSGNVQLVLNLPTLAQDPERLGYQIRRFTVEVKIPCLTSLDTAKAWLQSLEFGTKQTPYLLHV